MSQTFEEINPIPINSDFPAHKRIAIIMKKLSFGQYLTGLDTNSSMTHILSFCDDWRKSGFKQKTNKYAYNAKTGELDIPIFVNGERIARIIILAKDYSFKVEYFKTLFFVDEEKDDDDPYLAHMTDSKKFTLTGKSFVKYKEDEERPEERYIFPTGDHFYSYIKFFEENLHERVLRLLAIQDFNNTSEKVNMGIADFGKMCKTQVLDYKGPADSKDINTLIDDLLYMNQSKVERIQAGVLRITKTQTKWGTYKIYFGGVVVCNEFSLSKFRYIFHPGLSLVAKFLSNKNKTETLRHKIEKEMFRKL